MPLLILLLLGCTAQRPAQWTGPIAPSPHRIDPWDRKHANTSCIVTPHYQIYTDLDDREAMANLAQLMEGAHGQYRQLCPGIALSSQPMRCYIFSQRDQWAAFTKQHTGEDAAVYLQITRGAYSVDDWFVAFWLGDRGTYTVAAHEGLHQFVARHLRERIAPSLEEGLACLFENIAWENNLPRWNMSESRKRQEDLAAGLASRRMWSLKQLLRLHAGDVISLPREQIDLFYAQNWALALMLWEGEGLRYRPALQRYLSDLAAGRAYRSAPFRHLQSRDWNPDLSAAQLEHYLGQTLDQLEPTYEKFCRQVARAAE